MTFSASNFNGDGTLPRSMETLTFLKPQKSFDASLFSDKTTHGTSLFNDKHTFDSNLFNDRSTAFTASTKPADLTRTSIASSVLDKAVMDNLDLTFTEVMKKGEPSRKPWARSKSRSKATETLFADEIDKALASIPESLAFDTMTPTRPIVRPKAKPVGILKNSRPTTSSVSTLNYSAEQLAPLKSRLEQLRRQREQATQRQPIATHVPDLCQRLEALKV